MTHTPLRPGARYKDGEADEMITELEKVQAPTPYARGRLAALGIASLSDEQKRRVDALTAAWGTGR